MQRYGHGHEETVGASPAPFGDWTFAIGKHSKQGRDFPHPHPCFCKDFWLGRARALRGQINRLSILDTNTSSFSSSNLELRARSEAAATALRPLQCARSLTAAAIVVTVHDVMMPCLSTSLHSLRSVRQQRALKLVGKKSWPLQKMEGRVAVTLKIRQFRFSSSGTYTFIS